MIGEIGKCPLLGNTQSVISIGYYSILSNKMNLYVSREEATLYHMVLAFAPTFRLCKGQQQSFLLSTCGHQTKLNNSIFSIAQIRGRCVSVLQVKLEQTHCGSSHRDIYTVYVECSMFHCGTKQ